MHTYVTQLLSDLEDIILARWMKCPPHLFTAGLHEDFLEPPQGYTLPAEGTEKNAQDVSLHDAYLQELLDQSNDKEHVLPTSDEVMSKLEFDQGIAEMEQWLEQRPPSKQDMYYHFGLIPEQFPPVDQLTSEELDALTMALCRLWSAYNFTPIFPDLTPSRIVYPLLLNYMHKPTFVMSYGNIGIEFCEYDPKQCPFGEDWCQCKDFMR